MGAPILFQYSFILFKLTAVFMNLRCFSFDQRMRWCIRFTHMINVNSIRFTPTLNIV
nr:MAG TPA: hypothetical protein [Caudoviricetes sp.]